MEELELQSKSTVVMNASSVAIIDEAAERGLEEIFKLLLASVEKLYTCAFDLNRAYDITTTALKMTDWKKRKLDTSLVRLEF